jgi:hypothetical protein
MGFGAGRHLVRLVRGLECLEEMTKSPENKALFSFLPNTFSIFCPDAPFKKKKIFFHS